MPMVLGPLFRLLPSCRTTEPLAVAATKGDPPISVWIAPRSSRNHMVAPIPDGSAEQCPRLRLLELSLACKPCCRVAIRRVGRRFAWKVACFFSQEGPGSRDSVCAHGRHVLFASLAMRNGALLPALCLCASKGLVKDSPAQSKEPC